ncbi:amidohydrolase [Lentilactobacillus fungorum]|uniref:Amidohydrolase n=1 Tax=Lentilactobacillus fungorum TaxID=2201250 RepID=A0ABQ3VYA3_9LACO|nr:amidohydrolase family protein [Lentilactobacillus fungorum]GHP13885.1 amidohydrolase [Lentilactobacillus fungorum]
MTKTLFHNFSLFDGRRPENDQNAWFVVENGKLVDRGTGNTPKAEEEVNLKGKFVMPGFFNVHSHLTSRPDTFDGGFNMSETEASYLAVTHLRQMLKSGVTYVRECGDSYDVDIKLKRLMKVGMLKHVPELKPSGKVMSMTGGHGDGPHMAYLTDSPDEMRKAVRTALKNGAEVIKMMATGGVMTPGDFMADPQLSVAEMRTGVEEAHHKGIRASAHAEGNPGIQNALDAGMDSLEHGFYVNESECQQCLKQGTFITPTLIAEMNIPKYGKGKLPEWEIKKCEDALDDTYVNFKRAFKMGVRFTLGTDAGTPFNGFDKTPEEFEYLTKIGMTPAEAYQCSTLNSPELCDVAATHGTLEVGKFADFLVLDEDPLQDVKAVQQENKQVYLHGVREF